MFNTEAALVHAFKAGFCENLLKHVVAGPVRRFVLLEEFDSCNGVADIVLAIFRPYVRLCRKRAPINEAWVAPLAKLPEDKLISLGEYVALYGISTRTARRQIENYIQAAFIENTDNGMFRVTKPYTPVVDTSVAIEAKLRDWKRALRQAYRYKRFASYSFVLLPADTANCALRSIKEFERHNIGLLTLGEEGLRIHFAPKRRYTTLTDSFLRMNEYAYREVTAA